MRGQSTEESLEIYTEHPRLFLRPQRLRLLQRERDRRTTRWQQFETLMAGKAPMPETGFAQALYYQIGGDADAGKQTFVSLLRPERARTQASALVEQSSAHLAHHGQEADRLRALAHYIVERKH